MNCFASQGHGHRAAPLTFLQRTEADAYFFCIRGLFDGGIRFGQQISLQRRVPATHTVLKRIPQELGCVAAYAGDVLDNEMIVR